MNSITKTQGKVKRIVVKIERSYRMVKGDLGAQLKREKISIWHNKKHKPPTRKRGDIQGFSENSRSRLRVLLSTAKWKGGKHRRLGFTLTLPWAANPEEWRKVWATFAMRMARKYPDVALIWRIELTTGKAEKSGGFRRCHVHAIVWLPVDRVISKADSKMAGIKDAAFVGYLNIGAFAKAWIDSWKPYSRLYSLDEKQVKYAISVGEGKGFGVSYRQLDKSNDGCIHYLCDHVSKHKDEQLGWKGRQWGVINRHRFDFPSDNDGESISGRVWSVASRQLRRYSRKLRLAGSKRAQPYGDNKCFFGKSLEMAQSVIRAVKDGRITSGEELEI